MALKPVYLEYRILEVGPGASLGPSWSQSGTVLEPVLEPVLELVLEPVLELVLEPVSELVIFSLKPSQTAV